MRRVFLNGRQIEFGELNIEWSLTVDEVEEISIETNGEFSRALADAIYAELGLGWLPYPENKPETSDEFEVTALNQDGMKFVDMGYYATKDEKWYRAYAGNMGFYGIVAYRIKSAPYQPA